jgi:hypothetical protein
MDINISIIKVLIDITTSKNSMTANIGFDDRKCKFDRVVIGGIWREEQNTHTTSIFINKSLKRKYSS